MYDSGKCDLHGLICWILLLFLTDYLFKGFFFSSITESQSLESVCCTIVFVISEDLAWLGYL